MGGNEKQTTYRGVKSKDDKCKERETAMGERKSDKVKKKNKKKRKKGRDENEREAHREDKPVYRRRGI